MAKYLITTQKQVPNKEAWTWGTTIEYKSYIHKFKKEYPTESELKEYADKNEVIILMQRLADGDN